MRKGQIWNRVMQGALVFTLTTTSLAAQTPELVLAESSQEEAGDDFAQSLLGENSDSEDRDDTKSSQDGNSGSAAETSASKDTDKKTEENTEKSEDQTASQDTEKEESKDTETDTKTDSDSESDKKTDTDPGSDSSDNTDSSSNTSLSPKEKLSQGVKDLSEIISKDSSQYKTETVTYLKQLLAQAKKLQEDSGATKKEISQMTELLQDSGLLVNTDDTILEDSYAVSAKLLHAAPTTPGQLSMGNDAIAKTTLKLTDDGRSKLEIQMQPIVSAVLPDGKGYLGKWDYSSSQSETAPLIKDSWKSSSVVSYYNIWDSYNKKKGGTDSVMKGKKYPQVLSMPVSLNRDSYWIRVYVPAMEVIAGGGYQVAKLELDYGDLSGKSFQADMTSLRESYNNVKTVYKTMKAKNAKDSRLSYVKAALAVGRMELRNISASQESVDKCTAGLKKVIAYLGYTDQMEEASQNKKTEEANQKAEKKAQNQATKYNKKSSSKKTSKKKNNSSSSTSEKLDKNNLADGIYQINVYMMKTDKSSYSMSNNAVIHKAKLTVKNGKYYYNLIFKGLNISGKKGYLGTMKYYNSGYTAGSNGAPQGSLSDVTVISQQGVSDDYGSGYPKEIQIPMISETISDGYAPLQVFVPVMEAISAGTGTQAVYAKFDWSSLKTASDSTDFTDDSGIASGSSDSGSSSLSGGSSLGSNTLKSKSSDNGLKKSSLSKSSKKANTSGKNSGETADKTVALADSAANSPSTSSGEDSASYDVSEADQELEKLPPLRQHAGTICGWAASIAAVIASYWNRRRLYGVFKK